jgi:hypothetical protein
LCIIGDGSAASSDASRLDTILSVALDVSDASDNLASTPGSSSVMEETAQVYIPGILDAPTRRKRATGLRRRYLCCSAASSALAQLRGSAAATSFVFHSTASEEALEALLSPLSEDALGADDDVAESLTPAAAAASAAEAAEETAEAAENAGLAEEEQLLPLEAMENAEFDMEAIAAARSVDASRAQGASFLQRPEVGANVRELLSSTIADLRQAVGEEAWAGRVRAMLSPTTLAKFRWRKTLLSLYTQ